MTLKKSAGNMYPWVTHTHSHLAGQCPHQCSYCYVQAMEHRFQTGRYIGALRLDQDELKIPYGQDRTIFIEHMNDLFAEEVPDSWIREILKHCRLYASNTYVFQTKNPSRISAFDYLLPNKLILGTTIETNREMTGQAPPAKLRAYAMALLRQKYPTMTLFVTIEPIHDLDVPEMLAYLTAIKPTFVNIGADSKGYGLVEPSADKVRVLIAGVQALKIEIRKKTNLARLLGTDNESSDVE